MAPIDPYTSEKSTQRAPLSAEESATEYADERSFKTKLIPLDFIAEDLRRQLAVSINNDTINDCGKAVLSIITSRPDEVVSLANTKLHARPYKDVATSWRRAYEEATLWKIVHVLEGTVSDITPRGKKRARNGEPLQDQIASNSHKTASDGQQPKDWLTQIVEILDRALIMTGAPGRKEVIETLLENLSHYVSVLDPADTSLPPRFPSNPNPLKVNDSISRVDNLTLEAFQQHLDANASPLIIRNAISSWPALEKWNNPQYLLSKTINGRRLVPVELGKSYTSPLWSQTIMPFSTYLRSHLLNPSTTTGYLAQHDLLSQVSLLSNDTVTPDYCFSAPPAPDLASGIEQQEELQEPLRNAWLGPAGTISPLHTDPYHNILCQVVGRKYVRLYAPAETKRLYPRGVDERGVSLENTSEVDLEIWRGFEQTADFDDKEDEVLERKKMDFEEKFPLFKEAKFVEAVLEAGECFYIPVGWWHYIESLDVSFNVSYWFN